MAKAERTEDILFLSNKYILFDKKLTRLRLFVHLFNTTVRRHGDSRRASTRGSCQALRHLRGG